MPVLGDLVYLYAKLCFLLRNDSPLSDIATDAICIQTLSYTSVNNAFFLSMFNDKDILLPGIKISFASWHYGLLNCKGFQHSVLTIFCYCFNF